MSERHGFLTAETPKPQPAPPSSLGRAAKPDHTGRDRRKLPRAASEGAQHGACVDHVEARAEAEWRRRWRARLLWLKATLEFAAGEGPEEVAAALMAHLVLPSGDTMQRWAARELPSAYRDGAMPPLLLAGGGS